MRDELIADHLDRVARAAAVELGQRTDELQHGESGEKVAEVLSVAKGK